MLSYEDLVKIDDYYYCKKDEYEIRIWEHERRIEITLYDESFTYNVYSLFDALVLATNVDDSDRMTIEHEGNTYIATMKEKEELYMEYIVDMFNFVSKSNDVAELQAKLKEREVNITSPFLEAVTRGIDIHNRAITDFFNHGGDYNIGGHTTLELMDWYLNQLVYDTMIGEKTLEQMNQQLDKWGKSAAECNC